MSFTTMRATFCVFGIAAILFFSANDCFGQSVVKISPQPLHGELSVEEMRIRPEIFGNFMELLDDSVPSMWAEMLNDRDFTGIVPANYATYYLGEPNCYLDRHWIVGEHWTLDAETVFVGKHSAKLTATPQETSLAQAGQYVAKDKQYLFSGWFKTDGNPLVTAVLKAELPSGDWIVLASAPLTLSENGSEWTRVTATLTSKGTTDRAVFELVAAGEGTVWCDKLSLMPEDNKRGWRKDVVETIAAIKPTILRWGGSVCDPGRYRWKNAICPRDLREVFYNAPWGRIDSNDVGIEEFLDFCELVNAEPLICVSFSDGPESAADMVRYCNDPATTEWGKRRAENGRAEPHRVRYFQLGNELGGNDYADRCVAFCRAMKQADPNVLLAASYCNQHLLDVVGRELSVVAPHHYTTDLTAHDRDIMNHVNMIRSTPDAEHIKLGVTEWSFTAGDWGNSRMRLRSLYSGIYSAQYFNVLLRHTDIVAMACRSNLSNSYEGGTIMTRPGAIMKTPFYHVAHLYANSHQQIPVKVVFGPPGVDTFACKSEDGSKMTVFMVNTNGHAVDFRLDLTDWSDSPKLVRSQMVLDTLDRGQLEAVNHWSAPDRISTIEFSEPLKALQRFSVTAIELEK